MRIRSGIMVKSGFGSVCLKNVCIRNIGRQTSFVITFMQLQSVFGLLWLWILSAVARYVGPKWVNWLQLLEGCCRGTPGTAELSGHNIICTYSHICSTTCSISYTHMYQPVRDTARYRTCLHFYQLFVSKASALNMCRTTAVGKVTITPLLSYVTSYFLL
jgi:hypothetical protein